MSIRLTGFPVKFIARLLLIITIVSRVAAPFQKPAAPLAFEAASIKIDKEPPVPGLVPIRGGPGTDDPGRIVYTGLSLTDLIEQAYEVDGDQVSGRPADLRETRFIVTATFPPATTKEEFRVMLQNLLKERFHLSLRHDVRAVPGYELTVAPGGPRLRKWSPDPNVSATPGQPGQSGFGWKVTRLPPMIHVTNRQSISAFVKELPGLSYMAENTRGDGDRDERVSAGLRHEGPIEPLPRFTDRTGLMGEFEFTLDFEGAMVPGRSSAGGPTLAEAIEKQLGLKLSKVKRVPLDIVIVDHVDRVPDENWE